MIRFISFEQQIVIIWNLLSFFSQVCYEAGSKYEKLAPLYMNALDNELVMTLHRHTNNSQTDTSIMLELIFYILDK
jgi:hypothetical protein